MKLGTEWVTKGSSKKNCCGLIDTKATRPQSSSSIRTHCEVVAMSKSHLGDFINSDGSGVRRNC
jgi:hypothetical protein